MFGIAESAKKFLDDINKNRDMVIKAINSFISNVPEVTGLDEKMIKEVGEIIGNKSSIEGCYYIFGDLYSFEYIYNFLNSRDCYYINDIDTNELSVYLKYDCDEDGGWIPIIFIKEFWDFYSVYIAGSRKETKEKTNNGQNVSMNICGILDNAIELNHIRSSLENLNLHYNEICEILETIVKKLY